jgi:hypothetical protein
MPRQSMVRVLHPHYNPLPHGIYGERVYPTLRDYVEVPRLSTHGTWRIKDLLSPETIMALAKRANAMEKSMRAGMVGTKGKRA